MADRSPSRARRATNVSLPAELIEAARALDINISQACEDGLEQELKRVREARWLEENRAAIEASNAWVAEHGLPLARYRQF